MKNVLVTGGAGFIGSHVVDQLLEKDCNVTVLDNFSFGQRKNLSSSARVIEADIRNRDAVFNAISKEMDSVVHLAAIHFIPYCNLHPNEACSTNIEGTQNVFDAAQASGNVTRLFTASTAAVYPDCSGSINETIPRAPLDVYGMTKSANEEQAAILAKRSGINVSVGRFFNAIGGRETNPHLIPDILARLKSSTHIEIGNTAPKRDYIDVRDIASAVVTMLDSNKTTIDTCNIGTGLSYSVDEIIKMISLVHDAEITCAEASHLIRRVERMNLQADPERLRQNYGWKPRFTVEDAISYAYEWYVPDQKI